MTTELHNSPGIRKRWMMDDKAKELLSNLAVLGYWHVDAANLIAAAEMVKRGYATVYDDYEGPRLGATEKALPAAKRLGLVVKHPNGKSTYDLNKYTFVRPA